MHRIGPPYPRKTASEKRGVCHNGQRYCAQPTLRVRNGEECPSWGAMKLMPLRRQRGIKEQEYHPRMPLLDVMHQEFVPQCSNGHKLQQPLVANYQPRSKERTTCEVCNVHSCDRMNTNSLSLTRTVFVSHIRLYEQHRLQQSHSLWTAVTLPLSTQREINLTRNCESQLDIAK